MRRFHQILLVTTFLPLAWLGMMAVHELGHVIGAYATGGEVARVVLHPLTISRTDLGQNPSPRVVIWAGPVVGAALPLAASVAVRSLGRPYPYLFRFFAGFCLIANGAYLGGGSFQGIGDSGEMLRLGAPIWVLWLFAIATVGPGLFLWHGLGPHFGLGSRCGQVDRGAAYASCGLLLVALALTMLLN